MNSELVNKINAALRASWSRETCCIFQEQYPYYGQCAQTAIVIFETFGGKILRTAGWPGRENSVHFYNRIEGVRHDFTAEQFSEIPNYTHTIHYEDKMSSCADAMEITSESQVNALRAAFTKAFNESCA